MPEPMHPVDHPVPAHVAENGRQNHHTEARAQHASEQDTQRDEREQQSHGFASATPTLNDASDTSVCAPANCRSSTKRRPSPKPPITPTRAPVNQRRCRLGATTLSTASSTTAAPTQVSNSAGNHLTS